MIRLKAARPNQRQILGLFRTGDAVDKPACERSAWEETRLLFAAMTGSVLAGFVLIPTVSAGALTWLESESKHESIRAATAISVSLIAGLGCITLLLAFAWIRSWPNRLKSASREISVLRSTDQEIARDFVEAFAAFVDRWAAMTPDLDIRMLVMIPREVKAQANLQRNEANRKTRFEAIREYQRSFEVRAIEFIDSHFTCEPAMSLKRTARSANSISDLKSLKQVFEARLSTSVVFTVRDQLSKVPHVRSWINELEDPDALFPFADDRLYEWAVSTYRTLLTEAPDIGDRFFGREHVTLGANHFGTAYSFERDLHGRSRYLEERAALLEDFLVGAWTADLSAQQRA